MNKLKDFIYDKSDILVALLILALAGTVIFYRIDTILAYPETFSAEATSIAPVQEPVQYEYPTMSAVGGDGASGTAVTSGTSVATGAATTGSAAETPELISIYINYGESLRVISEKFVAAGLFESTDAFFSAVDAANAGTTIKAGNFIIPADATPEEVIEIITKPGL